jgi:hypothetical protein
LKLDPFPTHLKYIPRKEDQLRSAQSEGRVGTGDLGALRGGDFVLPADLEED